MNNINSYSYNGYEQSSLHLACEKSCENIIITIFSAILSSPPSDSDLEFINKQDIYGNTCLHYAIQSGSLLIISLLLEFNINTTLKNKEDKLAIDYANENVKLFINSFENRKADNSIIKYIIQNSEINEMNGLY